MKTAFATAITLSLLLGQPVSAQKPPQPGSPNVSPTALATVQREMTQQEVEQHLSARGDHQFTAALSNALIRCVSYYRNDVYGHYYLLFTNDHLAKVCAPPPFEMRQEPYMDSWANYSVLENPESRVAAVLSAEDLVGPQLSSLRSVKPPKQSVDWGLTAVFLAVRGVCHLIPGNSAREDKRELEFSALAETFNPYQIKIGTTVPKVEHRLGKPHITEKYRTGQEIRYYGNVEFGLSGDREMMWLSVVYENGKVIRVFSRDFVDYDKIRPLEERFRQSQ